MRSQLTSYQRRGRHLRCRQSEEREYIRMRLTMMMIVLVTMIVLMTLMIVSPIKKYIGPLEP